MPISVAPHLAPEGFTACIPTLHTILLSPSVATMRGSQEQGLCLVHCHSPVSQSSLRLYLFAWASMAKCHTLGGLDNRNIFSPGERRLEVHSQGAAGLVFSEAFLDLIDGHLLPVSSHGLSSPYSCVPVSSYSMDSGHIGLRLTLMTSF